MKRLPLSSWLLIVLATLLLVLPAGVLERLPEYRATIAPAPGNGGSVIVLFYGKRFDDYAQSGKLMVPPTGWTITRGADHVRLEPAPGAAPLWLATRDEPLYVSMIRHPGGGLAGVDSGLGYWRGFDLRAPAESIVSFQIGGPASELPPSATYRRIPARDALAGALATFLALLVIALHQWPREDGVGAGRQGWADLTRAVAIFGVVVIHACAPAFYRHGEIPRGEWLEVAFLDAVVRCAVPLFVMLSGALLLKEGGAPAGPREIARRVRKVLLPLVAWSAVYLLYVAQHSRQPVEWLSVLAQPAMYHLWFVYMIVGVYLVLPVLQALFNAVAPRRDLQAYLLVLWLVLTCGPLYASWTLPALLQQTSLLGYGGYFLLGAVLAAQPPGRPAWAWAALFAASVVATFVLTWRLSDAAGQAVETAYMYFSVNVVVASVAAFVLLARTRPAGRVAVFLHWVSDRSFLVFFMHVLVLERIAGYVEGLQLALPRSLELLAVALATFVICLAFASALRLVPKSREVTG